MDDLITRRKLQSYNFLKGCLKNEKVNHLFPLKAKEHNMQTRSNDKYEVLKCNTNRLKNSTVVYLQNLANELEKSN